MLSLVITGSPGVGKHTAARSIAGMLDLEVLDLSEIAEGVFEQASGTRDVDTDALKKRLGPMLGERSLVVGHLAPYVLAKSQVKRLAVLRKNPYKLAAVYKKRGYARRKAMENAGAEILGIIAHDAAKKIGAAKTVQIDTTAKSARAVALQTAEALAGKKGGDAVDWLSLVSQKNDLAEFFSYD